MSFLEQIHPEWLEALARVQDKIQAIERILVDRSFNPDSKHVFRALQKPLSEVSVVIFGQDPYPNSTYAMGLAFSVPADVMPLPQTLSNIFRELHDDIGCEIPKNGDLRAWTHQGVALINRILTVPKGQSGGHSDLGWQEVTNEIARVLGERNVVPILWGRYAQELAPYFRANSIIASVHPSPLSAYKGFFGSRPFSRVNQLLALDSRRAIDWTLV